MKALIVSALLPALLGGCAALSESECRVGDWYGIGERDGRNGRPDRIGSYAEACNKYAVLPDIGDYQSGRERGLRSYCLPENGYREGRSGSSYQGVCPAETASAFLREYERGRVVYELAQQVDRLDHEVRRLGRDIDRLEDAYRQSKDDKEKHRLSRERRELERRRHAVLLDLSLLRSRLVLHH
ncbi:DUF2799 domain-containing protein [Chitinimonas lacunae]|uniref:DUF2799 domain-containing protein n=1 Tax=Chitinimonas lacunae TaxID=1963018 RepID=A0ABV8MT87_9NEIS